MCGNVVEFCQDRFTPYKEGHQIDPLNLVGKQVVARGGDWFHAHGVDSETRREYSEDDGLSFLGFRLVREIRE
jgi:formylglycine-generating enzyme required for sulfatase activity